MEEMNTMKIDTIRSLIDQKLKKIMPHGSGEEKPKIGRKISYAILNGEFKLYNVSLTISL